MAIIILPDAMSTAPPPPLPLNESSLTDPELSSGEHAPAVFGHYRGDRSRGNLDPGASEFGVDCAVAEDPVGGIEHRLHESGQFPVPDSGR